MSRGYVRFENHFLGFENLDWNAKFKKHTDFANKQLIKGDYGYTVVAKDLQSKAAREEYKEGLKGYWLISCYEIRDKFGCDDLRLRDGLPEKPDFRPQRSTQESQAQHFTLQQTLATAKTFEELQATLGAAQGTARVTKHKRSISNSAETPTTKRAKYDAPANCLYFVWRGHYKKALAENIPCDDSQNTGYIEFTGADTLEFDGVISGTALGMDIPFKGYRISCDDPPPNKKNWEYYSFLSRKTDQEV